MLMEPKMMNNQLTPEQCQSLLDRIGTAVLSFNGPDGWPYSVPVNFVRIDDRIYYHGRKSGTRVVCMENDARCRLVAVDEKGYEDYGPNACDTTTAFQSVIVKGHTRSIDDKETKMKVLRAITDKLTPEKKGCPIAEDRISRTGVFEITMDEVTGKYHAPRPDSRMMKI